MEITVLKFVLTNFNSIKVRLKQRSQILNLLNDKFQFHKGTIKTR